MKLRWLLLSILGVLIVGSPADAGQLLSWDYEKEKNRLVFTTDEGVQPTAKLIANPTRLVIELPETTLGRTTVKEKYSGAVRGFRIGQSTNNTVSLVIELAPGYTINPEQVRFRGLHPTEWTVDLPSPRIADFPTARQPDRDRESVVAIPTPSNPSRTNVRPAPTNNNSPAKNLSPYIRTTSHGFVLDLNGDRSNKVSAPIRNGDTIEFDLEGVTLPSDLVSQSVAVNQYGVETITFAQSDPDVAKISLKVTPDSSEWRAMFSRIRGLILVPSGTRTRVASTPTPTFTKKTQQF